jgi:hypothetical protein
VALDYSEIGHGLDSRQGSLSMFSLLSRALRNINLTALRRDQMPIKIK